MPREMDTSGTRGPSSQGAAGAPALTILVVDHDRDELAATRKVLTRAGYSVKDASTFEDGRRLMAAEPPDVLIADVRLGAFNGLHLLVISRHDHPEMAAIITHTYSDPVLEAEAKHHGAAYLVKPIRLPVLLSTISEALLRSAPRPSGRVRRWPRKQLVGGLMASVAQAPATVLDVSYGGLQFEMRKGPRGDVPRTFDVSVPTFGLSVKAELVWTHQTPPSGTFRYGAALADVDPDDVHAWQRFVDSVA